MQRILVIDPEAKARAAEIVAYALEHPYFMDKRQPAPGDNPKFVGHFNSYRTVFTYTHRKNEIFRHLSVSVPGTAYPNPIAVWTLADLFGFTGWDGKGSATPEDWSFMPNENERCIVVVQRAARKS